MAPFPTFVAVILSSILPVFCTPVSVSLSRGSNPSVTIDCGTIVGTTAPFSSAGNVAQFLGVRFAQPPVRFAPPQPAQPWSGVYDASRYKPTCIQQFSYPEDARNNAIKWFNTPPPPGGESEDCLFLNVYAPGDASVGDNKAVMVWFYGGGFVFGSGAIPSYDGSSLAANQDVIVVTFNYRTNVFGFPGSPEIPKTQQNLGLLDQRLALDWVQRNIAAFGGDPQRVTIFGQSAGSGSVDTLITAPPEPVPFAAAIMESGVGTVSLPQEKSATSWQRLVVAAKCPPTNALACIRALPASQIKDMIEHKALDWFPIHDGGVTFADRPRVDRLRSRRENSRVARVPILIGSTANDAGVAVYGRLDVKKVLSAILPEGTPLGFITTLLAAYPVGSPGLLDTNAQLARILTELAFQCPSAIVAEDSRAVGIPSWRYFFNASFANSELYPGSGAYHSSEIKPVFGTYPRDGATPFNAQLSVVMQKAWADFAKNPTQGPGWASVPEVAVLGGGATPGLDDVGRQAVTVIRSDQIDQRCPLFKVIYDLASSLP
ncbi:hypothetical protein QQS21_004568 [Conoideocrella luteorostrata]|uniref:Carboxylic ester hydrolase n=1 Tax=Conoideocrella luteorostrata TaxID=1105319 RepID=A0AAJ0CU14_9HYPO|nr:hypothetical protein QQS21_004568 [Conoideocrella luteorostrata]